VKSAKIRIQIGSASAGSVVTLEHCRFSYAYMALAGYDQAVLNDVHKGVSPGLDTNPAGD
jgi:hypothetical protein